MCVYTFRPSPPSFPSQVVPYGSDPGSMPTHEFKIMFKEGGVGTFIPLFFNLLSALRAMNPPQPASSEETSSVTTVSEDSTAPPPPRDQFSTLQPPVEEMLRHAYVCLVLVHEVCLVLSLIFPASFYASKLHMFLTSWCFVRVIYSLVVWQCWVSRTLHLSPRLIDFMSGSLFADMLIPTIQQLCTYNSLSFLVAG